MEARGEWECVVSTGRGNSSRTVEIVVLENSASFCPEDKLVNNRGEFRLVRDPRIINTYLKKQGSHPALVFNPQVAQNSGGHHFTSVLPAAALLLPAYGGRY